MTKYYSNTDYPGYKRFSKPPRRLGRLILKVCLWTLLALVVIGAGVFWGFSEYLRPDHIASLIEKECAEYLKGEVKIGKLEYKVWSTYPWLAFEVDSLYISSRSLEDIPEQVRAQLPDNSNFLASVEKVKGKINIHSLLRKKINIKDVVVVKPTVNLVMVNDSTANFYILPPMEKKLEMPELEISEINMVAPLDFKFFSLQDDAEAKLDIASFYLARDSRNYNIDFNGEVWGRYRDYVLPGGLPLDFNTKITPGIGDLSLNLENLKISLAGLTLETRGEMRASSEGIEVEAMECAVRIEDLFTFITCLPGQITDKISLPAALAGNLPISLEVKLLSPLHIPIELPDTISLYDLPPLSVQLRIEDANIELVPPHHKPVYADDIRLLVSAEYHPLNPEETFLRIEDLHMHGRGISLTGNAEVENIMGEQQPFSGSFSLKSPVMETLSYFLPNSGLKVAGYLDGEVEFKGNAINMGKEGVKDIILRGDLMSHSVNVKASKINNLKLKNMKGEYSVIIPEYPLNNYRGTKMGFEFKADSIAGSVSGMNFIVGGFDMKLDAIDTISGTPDPSGVVCLKTKEMKLNTGQTHLFADNLMINVSGRLNPSGVSSNYKVVAPTVGVDDALIATRTPHTPLVLEYNGDSSIGTLMGMVDLTADINLWKGRLRSRSYLYPVDFDGLSISTDLNKVKFSASDIIVGKSGLSMSGNVEGLLPFMTSYSATPLKVAADMNFTNVDINELSWGYYGALLKQGYDSVFYVPPMLPLTASDSAIVAIPRNIDANIRLYSKSAEYMGYRFAPLSTSIVVKDGSATLSKLTIGAPYCTAVVDWTYSTSRLDSIFMDLSAQVKDFTFTPFYHTFPDMLKDASEMENLTGKISADIRCHFDMFPSMFMNPESLRARFDIKALNMQFARKGKVERITHLMLIEGNEPIQIENIDITGSFHNNVLQVNPFKIAFDGYQLSVGGVNNTAGQMYYHLALEKSPFHLPFGVSLLGSFKHPEVNVGGTRINDYKAEMVTIDNQTLLNVNIMAYLHHGWILFVQEAAKYQQKLSLSE